ncbi:MAG: hypothetical protein Q9228_003519 [Teloschistes exilis]
MTIKSETKYETSGNHESSIPKCYFEGLMLDKQSKEAVLVPKVKINADKTREVWVNVVAKQEDLGHTYVTV